MTYKKLIIISEVANASCFAYNNYNNTLINLKYIKISDYVEETNTSPNYATEVQLFNNLDITFSYRYDGSLVLEKFMDNDSFLITTQLQKLLFIDCKKNKITELEFNGQISCKIQDKILVSGRYLKNFGKEYELKLERGIGINPYYYNVLPKYSIYGVVRAKIGMPDLTFICNVSLKTGKELWSYDILERFPEKITNLEGKEEEVGVSRFMGDEPNKIWLYLRNGAVLVLDALTGKELALIGKPYSNTFKVPFEEAIHYRIGNAGYLDEKNKKVISLIDCYYHEINTETYTLRFIDLKEEFEKHSVNSIGLLSFDNEFIYFYDKKFMSSKQCCKIAILNRKTLKVDWSYDFAEKEQSFPMSLEVYGNKIFVVDGHQRLHIFEREK